MDNSNYMLGTDLYEDNTILDWGKLAAWAKFVYLRASIGELPDKKFVENYNKAKEVGLLVGAYHVLWPGIPTSNQVGALNAQMGLIGWKDDLPVAIDYETCTIAGVGTLPHPDDLVAFYNIIHSPVIIYGSLGNLKIAITSHPSLKEAHFWVADYTAFQKSQGEQTIKQALADILKWLDVTPDKIDFVQTASLATYPAGISPDLRADIDRAVVWELTPVNVPPAPPAPAPAPDAVKKTIVQIVVAYSDGSTEIRP